MKVTIIGCGWLGKALGNALVEAGHDVIGTSTRAENIPGIEALGIRAFTLKIGVELQGNFTDEVFKSDVFIISFPPDRQEQLVEVAYFNAMQTLLSGIRRVAARPKLIYLSSTGVYGQGAGLTSESKPPKPDTASARAVWMAEQYLQGIGLDKLIVLRLAGLLGGDRHPVKYLAGKTELEGALHPVNLVHQDDCVAIIQQIINSKDVEAGVYNVCADEHPSRELFYTHAAQLKNLPLPLFADDQSQGKTIDNRKLKEALDYQYLQPDPMHFPV